MQFPLRARSPISHGTHPGHSPSQMIRLVQTIKTHAPLYFHGFKRQFNAKTAFPCCDFPLYRQNILLFLSTSSTQLKHVWTRSPSLLHRRHHSRDSRQSFIVLFTRLKPTSNRGIKRFSLKLELDPWPSPVVSNTPSPTKAVWHPSQTPSLFFPSLWTGHCHSQDWLWCSFNSYHTQMKWYFTFAFPLPFFEALSMECFVLSPFPTHRKLIQAGKQFINWHSQIQLATANLIYELKPW